MNFNDLDDGERGNIEDNTYNGEYLVTYHKTFTRMNSI